MSEEKVHDLRADHGDDGVLLIVRKGNRYGTAVAGERVRVDKKELGNRSTMEACMTEDAYQRILDERAAKAAEREHPKKSGVAAAVDEGLARITREAEERAKRQAELEANAPPAAPESQPLGAQSKKPKKK
jgi:hypothetical protein